MNNYTRMAQISGDSTICRALSLISESNPSETLQANELYTNTYVFTGSIPVTLTELSVPPFLTVTKNEVSVSDIRITITGTPTVDDLGPATIDLLLNNCVGSLPADAYEILKEYNII